MQGFFITAFCENLNPGGVIFEKGETSLFFAAEAPCHVTWVPVAHPAELHIGTNETKGEHKTRKDTEPISSSISCKKHLIHVSVLLNRMCWGLISAPRGKGHSVARIHAAKPWRVTWPIVPTEKDLTPHLNTQAATRQENAHWLKGKPGEKHARHQQSTAPQPGWACLPAHSGFLAWTHPRPHRLLLHPLTQTGLQERNGAGNTERQRSKSYFYKQCSSSK